MKVVSKMMRLLVWLRTSACFVSMLWCSVLFAQTPDTAILHGIVVDPSGKAVRDATVTLKGETNSFIRSAISDSSGSFTLAGLPTDISYSATVDKEGFARAALSHLQFVAGSRADIEFTLRVAGGTSDVIVRGDLGDVRIDQPQLGIFLSRQQMEQTPLPYRRVTFLPLLSAANRPAINQGDVFMNQNLFNTNGAGRRQAWFEVDGANATDMWGRQTFFSNVPLMAVGEMTVLTNAFSSEFGASTGSVVNVVTRSGGDHFHGALLELWRPADMGASLSGFSPSSATSGNQITSDALGQSAASISGPLGRLQKTHFFTTGEWNREAKTSPISSPIAPGTYVGHYRAWLALARLDRQINANNTAFLRANMDSLTDTNPSGTVGGPTLPSVARIFHRRTYTTTLGETAVVSPYLVNNVRAQFELGSPITEYDPVSYSTQFVVPITSLCGSVACGTFTSGTSQNALLMNRQYELSETLSYLRGRNQLTAGSSVIAAHNGGNSKEFGGPMFLGKFTFNPCSGTPAFCESSAYLGNISNVANYQQSYGNAQYTVNDQLWAAFAQETFHASRRLVLSAGLRYERQTLTDANKNWAPRIGFVYDSLKNSALVFRGGFGIYYSQIVDNSAASYALGEPAGAFTYTATPGQVGFPSSISAAPLPAFPAGAVAPLRSLYVRPGQPSYLGKYFPTNVLNGYPLRLLNPYSEQYTASVEARLAPNWVVSADYVGTYTLRINRPLDIDAPARFIRTTTGTGPANIRPAGVANCTRPYWVWWYTQKGIACQTNPPAGYPQPPYSVVQTDVSNGYLHYNALDLNLTHSFHNGFSLLGSYTWSHTLDNTDPDGIGQNPNDPNATQQQEYGPASYDQRHRAVISGVWIAPAKVHIGGVATLASGLPFNYVTGTVNSGDAGATNDRPVINGAVIGRNAGRGRPIYSVDPFLSREFSVYQERVQFDLRAEAFNVLNHNNFVSYSGTYGNGAAPPAGFGAPLSGFTSQLPARFLQFSVRASF